MEENKLTEILSLLKNLKRTSNGHSARCPSHDDHKNSLSISQGSGGKVLLKCFAGCSYQDIVSSLGISMNGNGHKSEVEAIYDYTDENGNTLYQIVRLAGKEFRQRHFDKSGREAWNLNGVRRVPYRLAELVNLPAHYDFVMTEGEKDANTLAKHGLVATNHKSWRPEFNYLLKNRRVVIFQDHDKTGVELAEKAARMVTRDAKAVRIVDCFADEPLPEKHGKDVSDYLETHSLEELLELTRSTPDWTPQVNDEAISKSEAADLKVVRLSDVRAEEIDWLWKPFIPIGEFTILEGVEGLGKSWTCCAIACAVADGKNLPFSDSEMPGAGNVLMLSAEDSLSHTVVPRLNTMNANLDRIFAIDEVFSFSDFKDFIRFEAIVAEYEPRLIIIDPMFSYTGGKDLNQESASRPIARKLIEIAQKYQCAIIGVRHIGKSKGNGDARAAGLGSISWRASARSVLLVGKDEETSEIAIIQTKNNLAENSKIAVGFEIRDGQFYWASKPSSLTAERILAQPKNDEAKAEQNEAVEFLREALGDGERTSKEVQKEAKNNGITQYALRKAKLLLGVESIKKGGNFGGENEWYMRLPPTEDNGGKAKDDETGVEESDFSEIRHLQSNRSNNTSYDNRLAEDVENPTNRLLQPPKTTNSNGTAPKVQMKAVCKCGAQGYVGDDCDNCGEVLIPF